MPGAAALCWPAPCPATWHECAPRCRSRVSWRALDREVDAPNPGLLCGFEYAHDRFMRALGVGIDDQRLFWRLARLAQRVGDLGRAALADQLSLQRVKALAAYRDVQRLEFGRLGLGLRQLDLELLHAIERGGGGQKDQND